MGNFAPYQVFSFMSTKEIPYKRLIRLALLTTPLFALFGSMPSFFRQPFNNQPNGHLYMIVMSFTILFLMTALLWSTNILILKFSEHAAVLKKNKLRYFTSALLAVLVTLIMFQLIKLLFAPPPLPAAAEAIRLRSPRNLFIFPFVQSESINLIVLILIEVLLLQTERNAIQQENDQLKFANLEAKHTLLLQQLQPHFLFNALTTLKALIIKSPDKAETYLNKLTAFLRHSVNTTKNVMVPLSEELDLTTNYLEMQKVRFGEALHYRIEIPESIQEQGLVPIYSLQLLAENAIKHNILTLASPLTIKIEANIAETSISVSNNLQLKPSLEQKSGGVGLNNLSERYRLQGKPDIVIKKSPQEFSVHINVCKQ